ncbi:relaxase/mobilization nuclease domain-containing protein [Ruminococcus flavefaciens]|uniref:relaxase/mobilization nuclease domain-containing protein n=1 Tax=Ruminococcus flavefaciens TaxID=1265 RepID=UPI0026EBE65C|nr:relaxase/mobilization nuclease domain-containing protein [Ruminococcus flavefaciens]
MSIYKRINDSKNNKDAFERIIAYVTRKPYTVWKTDVGTVGCRKEAVLQDMTATKQSFHKDSGRQYEHAVLSITPDFPTMKDSDYMEIGRRIASHCVGHQCVYALHKDTRIRHLHFVWNAICYKNGKRFNMGPPGLNQEKLYINKILEKYDLDPIRSSLNEMIDTSFHDIKFPAQFLEIDNDTPDDRNMFLAPTPQTEKDDNDNDLNMAESHSIWFGNFGGNNMYNNDTPAKTSMTAMITAGNTTSSKGLSLVNVNNIKLDSINDLPRATSGLNDAFTSAARAGATALATMRHNGIDEGVTVTTVNNFIVNDNEATFSSPLNILDVPYKE